jgi:hypothetical protein
LLSECLFERCGSLSLPFEVLARGSEIGINDIVEFAPSSFRLEIEEFTRMPFTQGFQLVQF